MYSTGTATDVTDLVNKIDTFLTGTCGWTLLDTVASGDKVFFSEGSQPTKYRDIYIRWRGASNYLYVYGYTHWVNSGQYSDQLHDATNSRAPCTSPPVTYWLIGGKDSLIVVIKNSTSYHSMYGGLINSYYSEDYDDLPLCVLGHVSESTNLTGNRALMYVPFSVASGTSAYHHSYHTNLSSYCLSCGSPSVRDASIAVLPTIMYCDDAATKEVRGELMNWITAAGNGISSESHVVISGSLDTYLAIKHAATNEHTFLYGPI